MNKGRNLRLNLKGEWYKMHISGEKPDEYRRIKPYWIRRLTNSLAPQKHWKQFNHDELVEYMHEMEEKHQMREYDTVTFVYGYTRRKATYEFKGVSVGYGNPEHGAPKDEEVFIIRKGKKLR